MTEIDDPQLERLLEYLREHRGFDFSGYKNGAGASLGNDFGVRGMEGVWIDLHRTYGFYLYLGETASVARWFLFELEGGVGFQGRYP